MVVGESGGVSRSTIRRKSGPQGLDLGSKSIIKIKYSSS